MSVSSLRSKIRADGKYMPKMNLNREVLRSTWLAHRNYIEQYTAIL